MLIGSIKMNKIWLITHKNQLLCDIPILVHGSVTLRANPYYIFVFMHFQVIAIIIRLFMLNYVVLDNY